MEEMYYKLLNERNEAVAELEKIKSEPYDPNSIHIVSRAVKAREEFEKFCAIVLEDLMKKKFKCFKKFERKPLTSNQKCAIISTSKERKVVKNEHLVINIHHS